MDSIKGPISDDWLHLYSKIKLVFERIRLSKKGIYSTYLI